MENVYAALLLHSAKQEINEENVKKVLEAAGAQVDENKVKALVASLKDVNIDEALEQAVAMPVAGATGGEEKKEEEKKAKEEEKKEEEAVAGLSALFG